MFATVLLTSLPAYSDTLKPFISDGCSAFPEGTLEENQLWLTCCTQHDYDYWKGGTYEQRLDSDNRLRQCVSGLGEPFIGALMQAGVFVGGSAFWPTDFRWGYGWPYPRLYGELTAEEKKQVELYSSQGK
ncbi:MAG: FAD-binding oxidoreductase [Cellvibrionaceae bacterium]